MILFRYFILLLLIGSTTQISSQSNWLRNAGGNNLDEALDIAYSSNGSHYFVTGNFSGSCNFTSQTLASAGLSDGFLSKYNEDGEPVWAKRFGGTGSDKAQAVITDNQDNAYVCGYFNGQATFGTTTLTASDSSDIFVAKFSPFGDVIWAKSAGSTNNDAAFGIAVNPSGDVFLTGSFRGNASFGSISLSSANYSTSSNPSSDVFVAKLDNNGNWQWVKKGSGSGDEKATDISTDSQGGVYVCGQFSNDILFDVNHTNNIVSSGYVIKFNSAGQEQWFSRLSATQLLPQALRNDSQNNLYVTGESIGQIVLESSNTVFVTTSNLQSLFLAKYSASGQVSWCVEDGSDSFISARGITIGAQDEIYIAGVFECILTEYANELGDGIFNSAGYRDVFITRYNSDGTRIWMRQYGGPKTDYCAAIARGTSTDEPRIAGSYEKYFHAPGSSPGFTTNTTNFFPGVNDNLGNPNDGGNCNFGDYGSFMHLKALNNKDIFIGNLVDLTLPHYDYYSRGDCNLPIVEPCINDVDVPLECQAELTVCGSTSLQFVTNTGSQDWIGPAYNWEWNNGSTEENILASTTGWYWIESEREDGCESFIDSIYIIVLPEPIPLITDDEEVNIESPPSAQGILLCFPDEVLISGTNEDGLVGWWTDESGETIGTSDITVDVGGVYVYHLLADNGCEATNQIEVEFVDPLELIDPVLQFNELDTPINDTITICGNDYITNEFIDLLEQEDFPIYTDALWQIAIDTGYYPPYLGFESYTWEPQQPGWHYISATPFTFAPEPCPPDTIWYEEQILSVYINLLDDPDPNPQVSGDNTYCPGDTILLVATNGPNYTWNGPGIIAYLGQDSVLVNAPGSYSVSSFEEYSNGCSSTGVDGINIIPIQQPIITSDPISHVICPGDSVLLTCQPAQNYLWIGPLGSNLGSTQSIYTTQAGSYLCVATIAECTQESNVIEVENYATPYLLAMPGTNLCATGMATLIAQVNPVAELNWLPPLSGNALSINVFDPGIYEATVSFCEIETTVSIEITESNPTVLIFPSDENLCPGGSIILTATPGMSSYDWYPSGQNTSEIIITQPGTYYVEVENEMGCEAQSSDFNIETYDIDTPIASDVSACYGDPVTFTASGQGIIWSSLAGPLDIIGEGPTLLLASATYPLNVYAYASDEICYSLPDVVNLAIYPSSLLYIEPMDTTYCAGEALVISTQDPDGTNFQYNWTHPDGSQTDDAMISIDSSIPEQSGWYVLEAGDAYCDIPPDSIYIIVENPINDALISEPEIMQCVGSEVIIQSSLESETYLWSTPSGQFSSQEIIIEETTFSDEGVYTLSVPGVYCSTNSDQLMLDIVAYPDFVLNDSMVFCSGGYMTAHVPDGYDLYQWSTGSSVPTAIMPTDGFISVVVTNLPACAKTDSIQIYDVDCIDQFPNIFTPDGESHNDYVDFGWLRIPIDEVLIYNRWGNLIKNLQNSPFIWNGTNELNEFVTEGTYYYVIVSSNPGIRQGELAGYITVIFGEGARK